MTMAAFNEGHRYEDFDSSVDKVAAYGIGALVADKVATKTGILAGLLIFLKKFGVLIVAGVGGVLAKVLRGKKQG